MPCRCMCNIVHDPLAPVWVPLPALSYRCMPSPPQRPAARQVMLTRTSHMAASFDPDSIKGKAALVRPGVVGVRGIG